MQNRIQSDFDRAFAVVTEGPTGPREQRCPVCNSDKYGKRHHGGSFLAPEGAWRECDDCGHKSEVS